LQGQIKILQRESETLQEHYKVRKELYRTDLTLTAPNLSPEERKNLQEQSKILQKESETLQELCETCNIFNLIDILRAKSAKFINDYNRWNKRLSGLMDEWSNNLVDVMKVKPLFFYRNT
jgi:hypothetical protein